MWKTCAAILLVGNQEGFTQHAEYHGFQAIYTQVLKDGEDEFLAATRDNIIEAIKWLVTDVNYNDSLFLYL